MSPMKSLSLDAISAGLDSNDIESQVTALNAAVSIIQSWVDKAIVTFTHSDEPYLIAERLSCLGPLCLPHLQSIILDSGRKDLQGLAALVALQLGSRMGESILLEIVENVGSYACITARLMARYEVKDAIPSLVKGLSSMDISRHDEIMVFIDSLKALGYEFPDELVEKYTQEDVNWMLKSLFTGEKPQSKWQTPKV